MRWRDKSVLLPTNLIDDDEADAEVLPESVSITRIDELLSQMRFREVPKRALFSIPFELAKDFVLGIKGYFLNLRCAILPEHMSTLDTVW